MRAGSPICLRKSFSRLFRGQYLFSPLGWTAGVAGDEAAAEAALKSLEESDIAQRAPRAAVQTDGIERRIVVLRREKPPPVVDLARHRAAPDQHVRPAFDMSRRAMTC